MSQEKDVIKEFDVKTLAGGVDDLRFEGWLVRYDNRDSEDDIIKQGAFTESVAELPSKRRQFPVLYMHDQREHIGVFESVEDRKEGVFVSGVIAGDIPVASSKVIPLMRRGWLNSLSVGFTVDKQRFEDDVRIIEKGTLWEGSLVTIPANEEAGIISVKAFKSVIGGNEAPSRLLNDDMEEMTLAEVEARLAAHNISRYAAKKLASGLSRLRDEEKANQMHRDGETDQDGVIDAIRKHAEQLGKIARS